MPLPHMVVAVYLRADTPIGPQASSTCKGQKARISQWQMDRFRRRKFTKSLSDRQIQDFVWLRRDAGQRVACIQFCSAVRNTKAVELCVW